jgi:membrane-bound lytic murein transglycosylase D
MPAETRNYVPKLQAVKNIIANPAQYNVSLPAIDNQPYFTTVDKTSDIDLAVAAQLAEMSVDEFKALNPQFKKPVITGESTKILLPKENAEKFHLNLAQWGHALSSWTTHKITGAKESIASLASKFGTTPEVIRQANNIPPQMRLKAGSTILVPKTSLAPPRTSPRTSSTTPRSRSKPTAATQRRKGQKLSGAQRFKATAPACRGRDQEPRLGRQQAVVRARAGLQRALFFAATAFAHGPHFSRGPCTLSETTV